MAFVASPERRTQEVARAAINPPMRGLIEAPARARGLSAPSCRRPSRRTTSASG